MLHQCGAVKPLPGLARRFFFLAPTLVRRVHASWSSAGRRSTLSPQPFLSHLSTMELRGNPEWADVKPLAQDDGPAPVVPIAYPPRYVEVMDYLRAILALNEVSERALRLTTEAIAQNAANYTAWHHRRACLFALGSDLRAELAWAADLARASPKNYQLWHHVRALVDRIGECGDQLITSAHILSDDSKNYHVWSHRQWLCQRFQAYDGELAFIDRLLAADIRNNSAWNHRFFVLEKTTGFTAEVIRSEIKYTISAINTAPNNESPWNYLRGLLNQSQFPAECSAELEVACTSLLTQLGNATSATQHTPAADEEDDEPRAPLIPGQDLALLKGFLVDLFQHDSRYQPAIQLADELQRIDTIRRGYWNFRAQQLHQLAK